MEPITQWRSLWYFNLWVLLDRQNLCLKYQRCKPSGCKDKGTVTFEFVAKTKFLLFSNQDINIKYIYNNNNSAFFHFCRTVCILLYLGDFWFFFSIKRPGSVDSLDSLDVISNVPQFKKKLNTKMQKNIELQSLREGGGFFNLYIL